VNTSNPNLNGPFVIQKFDHVIDAGKVYKGFDIVLPHCAWKDIENERYSAKIVAHNEIMMQVLSASEDWKDGTLLAGIRAKDDCERFVEAYNVECTKYKGKSSQDDDDAGPPVVKSYRLFFQNCPGLFKGPFSDNNDDDDAFISSLLVPYTSTKVSRPDAHGRQKQLAFPYFALKWRVCCGKIQRATPAKTHDKGSKNQLNSMFEREFA
jgi:hypothetical protein